MPVQSQSASSRVFFADAESAIVDAVSQLIPAAAGLTVVGTARRSGDALTAVQTFRPHILVHEMSFDDGSGIDLVRDVAALSVDTSCVAFTRLPAAMFAVQYFRAGGRAFVSKSDPIESLWRAIRTVRVGGTFLSESEAGSLMANLAGGAETSAEALVERLSTSEFQVLQLISQGKSNRDIALTIHRSTKTVETYRARIKKKLGLTNSVELAQFAVLHLTPTAPGRRNGAPLGAEVFEPRSNFA